jgi:hypothetical protein
MRPDAAISLQTETTSSPDHTQTKTFSLTDDKHNAESLVYFTLTQYTPLLLPDHGRRRGWRGYIGHRNASKPPKSIAEVSMVREAAKRKRKERNRK